MRKNKIRILHVAQAAGGVDRYIQMLLKYLDKEKFENVLVCSQDFHEEDYRGLVDSFEQVEMTRAIGGNDLKAIREVRALIKKYNPDIVYAHSSKAGAIARVADIGLKNRCVYNPHGWAFNMRCSAKKKAIYTMIEKIAAPFCDKIICISDAEKQSALDKKICKEDRVKVYGGNNLKPAKSFLNLIWKADINYDYYALCDQDDVWKEEKIISAVKCIENIDKPALYSSAVEVVDKDLTFIRKSFTDNTFKNPLYDILTYGTPGCTFVFNKALMEKLYRQHDANVLGAQRHSLKDTLMGIVKNKNVLRSDMAKEILKGYSEMMPEKTKEAFIAFAEYKENLKYKLKILMLPYNKKKTTKRTFEKVKLRVVFNTI